MDYHRDAPNHGCVLLCQQKSAPTVAGGALCVTILCVLSLPASSCSPCGRGGSGHRTDSDTRLSCYLCAYVGRCWRRWQRRALGSCVFPRTPCGVGGACWPCVTSYFGGCRSISGLRVCSCASSLDSFSKLSNVFLGRRRLATSINTSLARTR